MSLASNIHELLLGGSTGTYSYNINNSLRFRSSASAYLSRTPASASNRTTWTWSGWVKRGTLGTYQAIFESGSGTGIYTMCWFTDANQIAFLQDNGSGGFFNVYTNAVFRDPSAWYHVVLSVNTTQAASNNRAIVYVNGVNQTLTELITIPQNSNTWVNSTYQFRVASRISGSSYFDGYMAEVNFIDGIALDASYFGATNSTTGTWAPKRYSGSYGTNGFYLPFSDTSGLTSGSNAGLGKDFSGNGNYWNTNNISLTAGSTYDAMLDSPTPKSSTVGNYAVLNAVAGDGTLSNANLTVAWSGGNSSKPATIGMSSGKWYCEIYMDSVGTAALPGLISSTMIPTAGYPGSTSSSYGYYYDGQKYNAGSGSSYGASYTSGDIIGIAFDADAGTLTFYKNGVSQGVAFSSIAAGTWFFAAGHSGTTTQSLNFGQRPFAYTPPTGYKALQTYNLPTPTIQNGANHFAATTYTGNGSTQSISNAVNSVGFKPDFVWVKSRAAAATNILEDSVRGVSRQLVSSGTGAEVLYAGYGTTAFNTNGFSVTDDSAGGYGVNGAAGGLYAGASAAYVAWNWKAGGTAVTNTAGSITSSVSANAAAGFSVVTYTGNQTAGATVGHGLGVAPSMIIVKARGQVTSWAAYHVSLGATRWILLNSTGAATTSNQEWNDTIPTTSVFSIGNSSSNSNQATTYVAYCFASIAGYSAFGSYTGNGSADGPFVYCGFRPRFILAKSSSVTGGWCIFDTSRNTYNVTNLGLYPNQAYAEGTETNNLMDVLSNGFKIRAAGGSDPALNTSGQTIIYAAFAENPFQYSLAR